MLTDHTSESAAVVFLLDVDNTLLDNDRFGHDLSDTLEAAFGEAGRERYWAIYEELRQLGGVADYLGALQRFRSGLDNEPSLLQMSNYLLEYPFATRLYPHALDIVAHLRTLGTTVILSDGDVVFQPRKIQRSGLWEAVDGGVLIYIHKERMLDAVAQRYPARHYVMIDDKLRILAEMKGAWGDRLTTVFARQGHYAFDAANIAAYPPAAWSVDHIVELVDPEFAAFLGNHDAGTTQEQR